MSLPIDDAGLAVAMQATARHKIAPPVNWMHGEDVSIAGSVSDDAAKKRLPQGRKAPEFCSRIFRQPS